MFPAMKTIKTRIDGSVVYAAIGNPPLNLLGAGFVTDLINLLNTLAEARAITTVRSAGLVHPMRSPRRWCFSHLTTAATSRGTEFFVDGGVAQGQAVKS
jgi:hypothetical protein